LKEGAIAFSQWSNEAPEILAQTIKIGDEVEAKVIPGTSKDDFIRLSKIKAEQDAAWNYVADLAEGEKRRATVKVLRIIKNKMKNIVGLAVAVEGVEGFMPASHVELRRVEDFSDYIGKELEAEVIEVDTAKKRLVVSRRDLLRSEKKQKPRLGVMPKKPGSKLLKKLVLPQKKPLMLLLKKDRQLQAKL
jgi:small subunit ribosomal protein S1